MHEQIAKKPRWSKALWGALIALSLGASSVPEKANPALWVVADEDTRIYMLGTIHILPDGIDWDDGTVGKAIAEADTLVMELSPQEMANAGEATIAFAMAEQASTIRSRLPEDMHGSYQSVISGLGFNDASLAPLDDWAIALFITVASAMQAGYDPENGLEEILTDKFTKQGKEILGLETARQQLMIFESMTPEEQRKMLIDTIEQAPKASEELASLVRAWAAASEEDLVDLIVDEFDKLPKLKQAILVERNRNWARWIKQRMDEPGTLLLAVGVGHLVGADSVQAMLKAENIEVKRLQ